MRSFKDHRKYMKERFGVENPKSSKSEALKRKIHIEQVNSSKSSKKQTERRTKDWPKSNGPLSKEQKIKFLGE